MRFQFEQEIELPRDRVFSFHEDPARLVLLHRGSPFRLLHHEGHLRQGAHIWFEVGVMGILPVAMGFEQDVYDSPHCYGEKLIHGPFRRFTHLHEFEETAAGTLVRDRLDVELPWYYGGEVMMKILVAPALQKTFHLRGETLRKLAQNGGL